MISGAYAAICRRLGVDPAKHSDAEIIEAFDGFGRCTTCSGSEIDSRQGCGFCVARGGKEWRWAPAQPVRAAEFERASAFAAALGTTVEDMGGVSAALKKLEKARAL